MADYRLGIADPALTRDPGAGVWGSSKTSVEMRLKKTAIRAIYPHAIAAIGWDATKNMEHYFGNSGGNLTLDVEAMIRDVKGERDVYAAELLMARQFCQTLGVGKHQITSASTSGGYAKKSESWNWFFATGGYSSWGKGTVLVSSAAEVVNYELDFSYQFFDRYNWDGGKSVTIFGVKITDEFMGRFHREGLAKEYDMFGTMARNIKWSKSNFNNPVITDPGSR